nr:CoA ester lyase [Pseudopontixanthobacter vadosimaris]
MLRSALYLPANRAGAVAKARNADCDAVILDLEDAVAPDAKEDARNAALQAAREGGFGERLLVVRVNGAGTPWHTGDLAALARLDAGLIDAVLLPKVSDAALLRDARKALPNGMALWAMVETCAGCIALDAIAAAGRQAGLTTLVMGTNDLALEMRCGSDAARTPMLPLLTRAVVTARAHGLAVLDGVFNALDDEDGLCRESKQGALLGFDGKTVIHPKQLCTVNAAFGPSPDEVQQARGIIAAFARPENSGKGVISHDGRMVELLHLRQAEQTVAMQEAIERRAAPGASRAD